MPCPAKSAASVPPLKKEGRGSAALLCLLMLALIASCGGAQKVDTGPRGTLRFEGSPADASIEVDETRLGPLHMFRERGLLLRPGPHRVIVRAPNHFPEYRIVEIEENKTVVLKIELRPIPL